MKIFAKSRTISLIVGLVLLILVLPGIVSAYSTSSLNATVISTTIPSSMTAGQSYLVSITMKNTGSMTWNDGSMIRLGGIGDDTGDAAQFGPTRINISAGTNVLSGDQYTFSMKMTAPAISGNYTVKYRMLQEGQEWFGARGAKTVQVVDQVTGLADLTNSAAPAAVMAASLGSPPKAQFTSDVTKGSSPLFVQFTDQSTGTAPLTYHWDFSDGEGKLPENSQKNPLWRFWKEDSSSFTVTLTVSNAYGSDTIVRQNYITFGTTPTAAPVNPSTSATGATGSITVTSPNGGETWQRGTTRTVTWDYSGSPGSYVKITRLQGGVEVGTISTSTSIGSGGKGSYTWSILPTGSTGSNCEVRIQSISQPTISDTSNGYFSLVTGITPTSTPTVAPAKLPAAQFAANTTQGKYPLAVQFTDKSVSTGTTSYAWDMDNDGVTDYTTKNPVYTYKTPGTFTVKLTVTNASGSDREIKTGYIAATSAAVVGSGEFGASVNPTGNPIGGGAGYSKIISGTEASVKYTVSTKAELLTALRSAKSGEIVFVKKSAVIDMTGTASVTIPAGVTLASDRGLAGSSGALIKRTKNLNGGWEEPMFIAGGDNVRVTGLRLEGEMYPQDYGNNAVYPGSISEQYYLVGLFANGVKNFVVDNNEMRGWAWSSVSLRQCSSAYIHHNYIHHNQARGEGYGVNLYGGNALIEANLFDYNRHDVTGAGMSGEQYEARYNRHLGHGNAIGATNYDVHQDEETGTGLAGNLFKIHHNTIDGGVIALLQVRGVPKTGMYVDHNIINSVASDTGVTGNKPIFQTSAGTGNMFVTQNYWQGKLYPTDSGIVVYY
jgi:PKD repeat protein